MSKRIAAYAFFAAAGLAAAGPAMADRQLPPGWEYNVQLFEHSNFNKNGGRAVIILMGSSNVPHYSKDGSLKKMQDKISSVVWNLPAGCKLKLYEHVNYKGKVQELAGSGRLAGLKGFNDKISSHQWVGKPACDKFKPKPSPSPIPDRGEAPGGTPVDPGGCVGRCQVFTVK